MVHLHYDHFTSADAYYQWIHKPCPLYRVAYGTAMICMAHQLTDLPGEIRNRIYEFVLSDSDSLMLWIDPAGIHRTCKRDAKRRSSLTYLFASPKDGYNKIFSHERPLIRRRGSSIHVCS